jgi:nucleoside-diphosphate-sugar epimerase
MRLAITGGRGFLGTHVARFLRNKGHELVILGRGPDEGSEHSYRSVLYEDAAALAQALGGADAVLHFAGIAHAKLDVEHAEVAYQRAILDVSTRVFNAACEADAQTFIFASSVKVYGESINTGSLDETSLCQPATPYGRAKLEAERALERAAERAGAPRLSILRLPPMYGPGMKGAVRHLFRAAHWHLPLPVHGYPADRGFLYVGNAARLVEAIVSGRMSNRLYLPHDRGIWRVGTFYEEIYRAIHGYDLPRALRWPLIKPLGDRLRTIASLQPLVTSMPLASKAANDYEKLPFLEVPEGLKETAHAILV